MEYVIFPIAPICLVDLLPRDLEIFRLKTGGDANNPLLRRQQVISKICMRRVIIVLM
jgi:hypothetical protein